MMTADETEEFFFHRILYK